MVIRKDDEEIADASAEDLLAKGWKRVPSETKVAIAGYDFVLHAGGDATLPVIGRVRRDESLTKSAGQFVFRKPSWKDELWSEQKSAKDIRRSMGVDLWTAPSGAGMDPIGLGLGDDEDLGGHSEMVPKAPEEVPARQLPISVLIDSPSSLRSLRFVHKLHSGWLCHDSGPEQKFTRGPARRS
jgi:hypothetical protein